MGKKQGVNQTSGPSCQGTAVLHAKVQKYETAELGLAGMKKDLYFIGGGNRGGAPKHLPHLFISCSTNLALGFAMLSNLWFHLEQ